MNLALSHLFTKTIREKQVEWFLWFFKLRLLRQAHKIDKELLTQIKSYLGVGEIRQRDKNAYVYSVASLKELEVIIHHFDQFPLITPKYADFKL